MKQRQSRHTNKHTLQQPILPRASANSDCPHDLFEQSSFRVSFCCRHGACSQTVVETPFPIPNGKWRPHSPFSNVKWRPHSSGRNRSGIRKCTGVASEIDVSFGQTSYDRHFIYHAFMYPGSLIKVLLSIRMSCPGTVLCE
jgi:hypothetical protein